MCQVDLTFVMNGDCCVPLWMGVSHYIVCRVYGEQITCLCSSQVFRLKGKALKELYPTDHIQDVLPAKGSDLMARSWSVSLSLMLWWDQVLEGYEEGCECIYMWEECQLSWLQGRLYCPKLTTTIFPVTHALPETCYSSSKLSPSLEQGHALVTNLLIEGSESEALWLLRPRHKGDTVSAWLCPSSHLLLEHSRQTGRKPRHTCRCSSQQTHWGLSCSQYQLSDTGVRKPLRWL